MPPETVEFLASGDGYRCHTCATADQIEHHNVRHRKRRGLLIPALLGGLGGIILALFHGGDSTLLMLHVLGVAGVGLGIGLRLAQRALLNRLDGRASAHWLAGVLYGVPVAGLSIAVGSPVWGLVLGIMLTLSFGLQSRINLDGGAFQIDVGQANHIDTQLAVYSVAAMLKHWREMLLMFTAACLFISAVFGLAIGYEAANWREPGWTSAWNHLGAQLSEDDEQPAAADDSAPSTDSVAGDPEELPCPEQAPAQFPSACPSGTELKRTTDPDTLAIDETCTAPSGLIHGRFLRSYPTGEPRQAGYYCNGDKNLLWTARHRDGSIKSEGHYQDGDRVGRWRFVKRDYGLVTYQDYQAGDLIDEGYMTPPEEIAIGHEAGCDSGETAACTMLGRMYAEGAGVAMDLARAHSLLRLACDEDDAIACTQLGILFADNDFAEPDVEAARGLFERGCQGGDGESCTYLGDLSDGDTKATAVRYARACELEHALGCGRLADLIMDDAYVTPAGETPALSDVVPMSLAEVRKRACMLGHRRSCRSN